MSYGTGGWGGFGDGGNYGSKLDAGPGPDMPPSDEPLIPFKTKMKLLVAGVAALAIGIPLYQENERLQDKGAAERAEQEAPPTTAALPETRVMSDGTELPVILNKPDSEVGPATIDVVNYWLSTGNDQALEDFGMIAPFGMVDMRDMYQMSNITPGKGINTPVWTFHEEPVEYPGRYGTLTTYELESGIYFSHAGNGLHESPMPTNVQITIQELDDGTHLVSSVSAGDASAWYNEATGTYDIPY